MSTSKTDIANLALSRLGQRPIAALSEQSAEGVVCNDKYDLCRRITLAYHTWRFAVKNVTLAPISQTTVAGQKYLYEYTIPSDCIRVVGVEPISANPPIEFEKVGDVLRTDDSTGEIRYIWDVTDTNDFDMLFVDALAWKLAAEIAPTIVGKIEVQNACLQAFSAALRSGAGASAGAARQPERTGQDIKNSRR